MIITWINLIFLILMLAAMYSTYQNRLLVFQKTDEFVQLVDEARSVKQDLEQLLDQLLHISGNVVDNVISEHQSSDRVLEQSQLLKEISLVPALDNSVEPPLEDIKAEYNMDNHNIFEPDPETELPTGISQRKTSQSFDLQNFHTLVKNLYQRGFTTKEIAQKLDKGQDEVSLIINLLDMQYINT